MKRRLAPGSLTPSRTRTRVHSCLRDAVPSPWPHSSFQAMGLSGRRTIQLRWSLRTPLRRGDKLGLTLCSAGGRTGDPEPETRAGNPVLPKALWTPKEFDSHLQAARALGGIRCGAGVRGLSTSKGSLGGAWGRRTGGRPDRAEGSAAAEDVSGCPQGPSRGCGGAWRGRPWAGVRRRARKPLRSGAASGRRSPGQRQARGEGFRETAAQETASPGVPSPTLPAP